MVCTNSHFSYSIQQDLVKKAEHLVSYNKGDQGFLNAFFDNWFAQSSDHRYLEMLLTIFIQFNLLVANLKIFFNRLPMSYNTLLFFPTSYNPPKWFDRERLPELLGEQVLFSDNVRQKAERE